jgi:hypothetical protein
MVAIFVALLSIVLVVAAEVRERLEIVREQRNNSYWSSL